MFQGGELGDAPPTRKWAVRGKTPDCPFLHFVYTNALLANFILSGRRSCRQRSDLGCSSLQRGFDGEICLLHPKSSHR